MTLTEYKLAENEYAYALERIQYLSNLYYTLKDILKQTTNHMNKLNKRVPVSVKYVHHNHNFNSADYDGFYYSGVNVHLSDVQVFEINVSNFLMDDRSKDVIEAFPNGAGWQEDHWYTRNDIPQLLKVIKNLRRDADLRFHKARAEYEAVEEVKNSQGFEDNPASDLKRILDNASSYYYDVSRIKDFLKEKGIDVD